MMRVLVMSDSHGNEQALRRALSLHPEVNAVIHLGDGAKEARRVQADFSDKQWYVVRGNCDYGFSEAVSDMITLGGKRLFLTHGYAQHVKSGLLSLSLTAVENEADMALFGHTHLPTTEFYNGVQLFNPGSIGSAGHYGILEIDKDIYSTHLVLP